MARMEQDHWRERHTGTSMRARRVRPPMPGRQPLTPPKRLTARQAWLARQQATDHDETMFLPTRPGGTEPPAPARQATSTSTWLVVGLAAATLLAAAFALLRG